ncbi:hypothetical protein HDU98_001938 [Podochytrium sp. JEL0797]|nr:hypothetical protein HDU98_001938 [Podochytrium sp. JEL0797]
MSAPPTPRTSPRKRKALPISPPPSSPLRSLSPSPEPHPHRKNGKRSVEDLEYSPATPSKRSKSQVVWRDEQEDSGDLTSPTEALDVVVHVRPQQLDRSIAGLPREILQALFSLAFKHPNHVIRAMGVCWSFWQAGRSHPIWMQLVQRWNIPFTPPKLLNRDYHRKLRMDCAKRGKKYCEVCAMESTEKLHLGRDKSNKFRQRLCRCCFATEFRAFRAREAGNHHERDYNSSGSNVYPRSLLGFIHKRRSETNHWVKGWKWRAGYYSTKYSEWYDTMDVTMLKAFAKPV